MLYFEMKASSRLYLTHKDMRKWTKKSFSVAMDLYNKLENIFTEISRVGRGEGSTLTKSGFVLGALLVIDPPTIGKIVQLLRTRFMFLNTRKEPF